MQKNGIKPFLNGQRIMSSGLEALDKLLGGGLLLGSKCRYNFI